MKLASNVKQNKRLISISALYLEGGIGPFDIEYYKIRLELLRDFGSYFILLKIKKSGILKVRFKTMLV
jgi:hypothetical protein